MVTYGLQCGLPQLEAATVSVPSHSEHLTFFVVTAHFSHSAAVPIWQFNYDQGFNDGVPVGEELACRLMDGSCSLRVLEVFNVVPDSHS